jgi:hypothetical protein
MDGGGRSRLEQVIESNAGAIAESASETHRTIVRLRTSVLTVCSSNLIRSDTPSASPAMGFAGALPILRLEEGASRT